MDFRASAGMTVFGFCHLPSTARNTLPVMRSVHKRVARAPATGGRPKPFASKECRASPHARRQIPVPRRKAAAAEMAGNKQIFETAYNPLTISLLN